MTIGLIIMLIVLLATGGDKKPATKSAVTETKKLVDFSNTGVVARLTVDGPTNSQQEHNQLRISVSKDKVIYQELTGYNGQVTELREYANSPEAYASFLRSLQGVGYTNGNTDPANKDERGHCPLGNRYIFELIDNGKSVQRFWSTSCNKAKTYEGNTPTTLQLFKNQIADYIKRTPGFELNVSL